MDCVIVKVHEECQRWSLHSPSLRFNCHCVKAGHTTDCSSDSFVCRALRKLPRSTDSRRSLLRSGAGTHLWQRMSHAETHNPSATPERPKTLRDPHAGIFWCHLGEVAHAGFLRARMTLSFSFQ